jgi:hypothetical protein
MLAMEHGEGILQPQENQRVMALHHVKASWMNQIYHMHCAIAI